MGCHMPPAGNMLRPMRRLAALLSFVALAQSVVLRAGVLCEGADAGSAAALPMAGMDMGAMAQDPAGRTAAAVTEGSRPDARHHDGRHDGAHCPLMGNCVAAAVTVTPIKVSSESRPVVAVFEARKTLPHSETAAPEPPPPKG